MNSRLAFLLLAASLGLVGIGMSLLLLTNERKRLRDRAALIHHVAAAHRAVQVETDQDLPRLDLVRQGFAPLEYVTRLIRYNPAHAAIYPAKPAIVVLLASIGAAAMARASVFFVGHVGWFDLPFTMLALCRWFYGRCESRHAAALFKQLPDALAMIIRAIRVGVPLVEALRVVAKESSEPTAGEFSTLSGQTSIGVPLDDALRDLSERNGLPEYRFLATALALQSQTGGGLAETLENLAETIRKRLAARLRGHALASEARTSALILGALPLVTGGILALVDPDYIGVLFTDPTGRIVLLVGIGLLSVGAFSMRVLIRKSLT